jgi:predicted outer membrane repeat protein
MIIIIKGEFKMIKSKNLILNKYICIIVLLILTIATSTVINSDEIEATNPENVASNGSILEALSKVDDGGYIYLEADSLYNHQNVNYNLTINKSVSIIANNSNVTIQSDGSSRIFNIISNINVTFINITFKGGHEDEGGAIYFNGNKLSVINCKFQNNTANDGGAIYNSGNLSVSESVFYNNSAINGGGIYSLGIFTLNDSNFTNNSHALGLASLNFDISANNIIVGNSVGIQFSLNNQNYYVDNILSGSILINNTYAISLDGFGNNYTLNNTILCNNDNGVLFGNSSHNNTLNDVVLSGFDVAVTFDDLSSNNVLLNANIYNNSVDVLLGGINNRNVVNVIYADSGGHICCRPIYPISIHVFHIPIPFILHFPNYYVILKSDSKIAYKGNIVRKGRYYLATHTLINIGSSSLSHYFKKFIKKYQKVVKVKVTKFKVSYNHKSHLLKWNIKGLKPHNIAKMYILYKI